MTIRPFRIALLGPYPAQAGLREEQIRPARRGQRPHPATWIEALCGGLAGLAGVEARLFVHSRAVSAVQTGALGRVGCCFVPKFEPGNLDCLQGDWTARVQMRPLVRGFDPDVVLGFGTESMYGLLASAFGRPSAVFIQGIAARIPLASYGIPRWQHGFLRRMERRAIRRADAVIAENQFAADWARSVNPFIRTAVIPHPMAAEFVQVQPDYSPRILFVGAVNSNKRPDMAARAFARICAGFPEAELVIAGPAGDVTEPLKAFIAERGLTGRIRLAGALKRGEVLAEMARSRALVLASRMDTSPNVVTEAHAAGLPVIATRVGGIPEMVEEGRDGFLVEADDEAALADRMKQLLSDRALAVRLGACGREKTLRMNTAEEIAARYVEFFRSWIPPR